MSIFLYKFYYISFKTKLINILTNLKRVWEAVQVSKILFINKLKNLICLKNILDSNQKQSLKISKIKSDKKFGINFYNKKQNIFYQLAFLLKNIKNKCSRNLFKSLTSLFDVIIFITAEGGAFLNNMVMGGSLK